jgi:hypothetical protein
VSSTGGLYEGVERGSDPLPYAPFTPVFLPMSDMWQLRISRAEIEKSQVMKATWKHLYGYT